MHLRASTPEPQASPPRAITRPKMAMLANSPESNPTKAQVAAPLAGVARYCKMKFVKVHLTCKDTKYVLQWKANLSTTS